MWKFLKIFCMARDGTVNQRNQDEPGIFPISAVPCAPLLVLAPDTLEIPRFAQG